MPKKAKPRKPTASVRTRLLERSRELRADIARELRKYDDEHYAELAERFADSGEQSVADLLVDLNLAEISRDVAEFRDIEAALLRLAHGTYGACVDCGTEIDPERLRIAPSAARCLPCQQRYERQNPSEKHPTL
jgi:RNA polymerase-binding transcription factor DksA